MHTRRFHEGRDDGRGQGPCQLNFYSPIKLAEFNRAAFRREYLGWLGARWLALADTALRQGASEENVAETEALGRKEQTAIKRRIRRVAEKVKRQSKSEQ